MRRLVVLLLVLGPLALLASACGGGGSSSSSTAPFALRPTAKCLEGKGYKVSTKPADLQLVIATADNGGLHAVRHGDTSPLEIAFAANAAGAREELKAIRNVAPKSLRPHIADITRVKRNAVLLWTVAPSQQDEQDALGCLSS
jgi:hypothetical protein